MDRLLWNAGKENWKNKEHIARLTAFYSKYQPSKVLSVISYHFQINSITKLLAKYEGRELEMYNNIYAKYGVDALSPSESIFIRFILWLGAKMENTYILREYYKIHNPEKESGIGFLFYFYIVDVPELIKKYQNDYDLLFRKMEKKYGIDPRSEISV